MKFPHPKNAGPITWGVCHICGVELRGTELPQHVAAQHLPPTPSSAVSPRSVRTDRTRWGICVRCGARIWAFVLPEHVMSCQGRPGEDRNDETTPRDQFPPSSDVVSDLRDSDQG